MLLAGVLALCAFSAAAALVIARIARERDRAPMLLLACGAALVVVSLAGFLTS